MARIGLKNQILRYFNDLRYIHQTTENFPGYLSAHALSDVLKAELSDACKTCGEKASVLREMLEQKIVEAEISAELRWSGKSEG